MSKDHEKDYGACQNLKECFWQMFSHNVIHNRTYENTNK